MLHKLNSSPWFFGHFVILNPGLFNSAGDQLNHRLFPWNWDIPKFNLPVKNEEGETTYFLVQDQHFEEGFLQYLVSCCFRKTKYLQLWLI